MPVDGEIEPDGIESAAEPVDPPRDQTEIADDAALDAAPTEALGLSDAAHPASRRQTRARSGPRASEREAMLLDKSRRGRNGFLLAGSTFHEAMDAVWELEELIAPHIAGIDQSHFKRDVAAVMQDLSSDDRKNVGRLLELVVAGATASDGENGQEDEARRKEFVERYARLGDRAGAFVEVMATVRRVSIAPEREPLLRGALLAVALGALDVLVAQIATSFYRAHPTALGDEPRFTLSDLEEFETLQDARDEAIAKKVDSLVHGDLNEWTKWFDKTLGINLPNLTLDYPVLFEVFQRRHLIIHSGGRVSRLYLVRMKGVAKDLPPLGTPLVVDGAYLRRALDEIETVGDLLTAGAWSKCWPDDEEAAATDLHLRSYDLMLDERWEVVRAVCAVGTCMNGKASDREIFRVNAWLAQKRLGNYESFVSEVEAWDTSVMQVRFRLVQAALQDQLDVAFEIAEQLLEQGEIEVEDIEEWPVLTEFRADPRCAPLCDKYKNTR